jgi:hypothetical protein
MIRQTKGSLPNVIGSGISPAAINLIRKQNQCIKSFKSPTEFFSLEPREPKQDRENKLWKPQAIFSRIESTAEEG